jgi:hypothetical protein
MFFMQYKELKFTWMTVSMQANSSVDVILGILFSSEGQKLKEEFCGNNKSFSLSRIYDV